MTFEIRIPVKGHIQDRDLDWVREELELSKIVEVTYTPSQIVFTFPREHAYQMASVACSLSNKGFL